jgi:hypothetical protein
MDGRNDMGGICCPYHIRLMTESSQWKGFCFVDLEHALKDGSNNHAENDLVAEGYRKPCAALIAKLCSGLACERRHEKKITKL